MSQRLILILISLLGTLNIVAQEADSVQVKYNEISIDSLVVKLNTLQHNYDYLYCDYELKKLILELKDFSNSVSVSSNSLLISYYNTKFDRDLYISYLELYNANTENFNSLKENIDVTKLAVTYRVLSSNFTEQELKVISSSFELIDKSISTADQSLKHFKVIIDAYKSLR